MSTFTWIPSYTSSVAIEPRVFSAKFGDGYEQRVQDGINPIAKKWSVIFDVRTPAVATAITDFLKATKGAASFDWTDPEGEAGKYVCRKFHKTYTDSGIHTLNAEFEQVYGN